MAAKKVYLAIDWGGTYIKAGLVDQQEKLVKKVIISSQDLKNKDCFIRKIQSLINDFSSFNILGLGIGAPGIINRDKGVIYYLPNITGWENYPLKDILTKKLGLPVFLENDACLFALAESRKGAAKGKSSGIFLTLGTGLGGSVLVAGDHKPQLIAAELGHVSIDLQGSICGCGGRGCIETFIGSNYLLNRYNALNQGLNPITQVKEIFERAKNRDPKAIIVWEDFSLALGSFLGGMINVFAPEIIVFGGGVSGAFSLFKPMVLAQIKKQAMWPFFKKIKLVKAKVKDAGVIGAGLLVKNNLG